MVAPVDSTVNQPAVTTAQDTGADSAGSTDDDVSTLVRQALIQMTVGLVGNMPKLQQNDDQYEDDEEDDGF